MENRKGNGIFLGIVSVATLIVAIIGATFAYFSASTESNENAIGLTAYEYKLSLSVNPVYPVGAAALIPLNPTEKLKTDDGKYVTYSETGTLIATEVADDGINLLHYALNEAEKRCIDDNGLQVCALYEVVIENSAVNEIVLSGQLQTMKNQAAEGDDKTPFKNLQYLSVTGNEDDGFTLGTTPVAIKESPADETKGETGLIKIDDIEVPGATTNAQSGKLEPGIGRSYVLIYLNDKDDQSSEMGATFEGKLIYSSGEGEGSTLSGSFKLSSDELDTPTVEGE